MSSTKPKSPCPHCGKEFQKVQEHITKMHSTWLIKRVYGALLVYRNGELQSTESHWGSNFGPNDETIYNGEKYFIICHHGTPVAVYHAHKTSPEKHGVKAFAKWSYEIS